MAKYRKKPIEIEAVLWDGKPKTIMGMAPFENAVEPPHIRADQKLEITTLEGVMTADPGDWIIRGVQGEIYPCKPDIFAATYEPAE